MIALHKLGHNAEAFHLNPDLMVTIESHPDTVITLSTGQKVNVLETPDEVVVAVLEWRRDIAQGAVRSNGLKPAGPHPIT